MTKRDADSFTCACCHGTFTKGRSDADAEAEAAALFPGLPDSDRELVCEDCFQTLMKGKTPMSIMRDRLYVMLNETTIQLRKGPRVRREAIGDALDVTTIDDMPHVDNIVGPHLVKVDMELLWIGVDSEKAERDKVELVALLETFPAGLLASGPSYITLGAEIGDQGLAFQLMALGKVLGLWDVITPTTLFDLFGGFSPEKARALAGQGLVMISGYNPVTYEPGVKTTHIGDFDLVEPDIPEDQR